MKYIKFINVFLMLLLLGCKAQNNSHKVEMVYNRLYGDREGHFTYDSSKDSLYVKHRSENFEKNIQIKLSQEELQSIYKDFKASKLSSSVRCIYDDDGTIISKTIIYFKNEKQDFSSQKCIDNELDYEKFSEIESKIISLLKSKSEYRYAFPHEFEGCGTSYLNTVEDL